MDQEWWLDPDTIIAATGALLAAAATGLARWWLRKVGQRKPTSASRRRKPRRQTQPHVLPHGRRKRDSDNGEE